MNASEEYDKLLDELKSIEKVGARQDSKEYQEQLTKCLAHGLNLKTFIQTKSHLFSTNETLDDLSTKSLRFLSLDYYLAQMMVKKQVVGGDSSVSRNVTRLKFLQKTVQLLIQFQVSLQDYGILDKALSKRLDGFESIWEPKLEELYTVSKDEMTSATLKRQEKIALYRTGKEIETKIKLLEERLRENDSDEEVLRELYLIQLRQLSYEGWNQMEQILMEIELLKNFTKDAPTEQEELQGMKEEPRLDPTSYTEKLESLNKPLLSKSGKVLRNFTLLDTKDQLKSKVFGYGQYGPTMTVEEFLAQEFEQNRVLQGGAAADEEPSDEDNEESQDKETYKAREWDEFKEANPRGSGNTINRG